MQIEIVGNGGREHALAWKLTNENCTIKKDSDFVIIGPEVPIAQGLVEQLKNQNKTVFAPSKLAGRLETSKVWAKKFMHRNNIPTADFKVYNRNEIESVLSFWQSKPDTIVVKEDGLCGGKGVAICKTVKEKRNAKLDYSTNKFKADSDQILLERFIRGEEASCFVLTDGKHYKMLPYCQDHKRVGDNDTGPNTGGMGAYAPAPIITKELDRRIKKQIIEPTLAGMNAEDCTYTGILYIGLMIVNGDPYVIEYNVRFGDPECQVLMMMLKSDLMPYLKACTDGTLNKLPKPKLHPGSAITVCMCSEGYPSDYKTGYEIQGLQNSFDDVEIFHAGTKQQDDKTYTDGGRVLNVTARANTLANAQKKVYDACDKISWTGSFYRKDIGNKAL